MVYDCKETKHRDTKDTSQAPQKVSNNEEGTSNYFTDNTGRLDPDFNSDFKIVLFTGEESELLDVSVTMIRELLT